MPPTGKGHPPRIDRRGVLALGACAWLGSPQALADAATAQVADTTWHDTARSRELPVRIRWPDPTAHPGPRPVVLYSHGLGGSRAGAQTWGAAWAAAGFVVIHLQHPGSDLAAVRAALASGSGLRAAAAPAQLIERLRDVSFALDEIARLQRAGGAPWTQARPTAIGMAGHSFGAHTTLAMAGQRFPIGPAVDEPRLAAFMALSPSLPASGDPRLAYAGIQRPLLCLTGTRDDDVIGNGSTPQRRRAVFDALPDGGKAQLVLQDADHATFGGDGQRAPQLLRPRDAQSLQLQSTHAAVVEAITTDWWRATLLQDAAAMGRLQSPAGLRDGDSWQHK